MRALQKISNRQIFKEIMRRGGLQTPNKWTLDRVFEDHLEHQSIVRMTAALAGHFASDQHCFVQLLTLFDRIQWTGVAEVRQNIPLKCSQKEAKQIQNTRLSGPFWFSIHRKENVCTYPNQKKGGEVCGVTPKKGIRFLGQRHAEILLEKSESISPLWRDLTLVFPATVEEIGEDIAEKEGCGSFFCPSLEYRKGRWHLIGFHLFIFGTDTLLSVFIANPRNGLYANILVNNLSRALSRAIILRGNFVYKNL
jgi:hypothetical protein